MDVEYSATVEIVGKFMDLVNKNGPYGDYHVVTIKSGAGGESKIAVTFGKRFNNRIKYDDFGRNIRVRGNLSTWGGGKNQGYKINVTSFEWL